MKLFHFGNSVPRFNLRSVVGKIGAILVFMSLIIALVSLIGIAKLGEMN